MWIFGYGSLLWYQDFPFVKCLSGTVRGCSRRFWQLSPDHRGTPEKPGRTVSMVFDSDEHAVCWGKVFKVPDDAIKSTIEYLDFREKAGYVRVPMTFYPDDKAIPPFEVETYMNVDDEMHRSDSTEMLDIANTIFKSVGPSGPNIEYLLKLSNILRKESPLPDPHVFELEKLVLNLCKEAGLDHKPYMERKPHHPFEQSLSTAGPVAVIDKSFVRPFQVLPVSSLFSISGAMQEAKADYSSIAPLLTAKMMEMESAVRATPAGDAEDSFHSVTSTMSGYTRKKLSETRNVSLTRITIPQNGYSQKPTREPTLTSQASSPLQANSPLYQFMTPNTPNGAAQGVRVRVYLPHLFGEEQGNKDDSTCVVINTFRGDTAGEILRKVAEAKKVDHPTAKETFALWMCSPLLELQLKEHHIPCDLFRGWKDLLTKFAADSSPQEQTSDQPLLYLKRNVHLSIEREIELMESEQLVNMLWWEAKTTLFDEKYYLDSLDAANLAGIGFAIDYCGKQQPPLTIDFVRRNLESQLPDNLADAIRGPMMFGKTLSSGSNLEMVLDVWKKASSGEPQAYQLQKQYLAHLRENCQQYGCAFFSGFIERPSVSPLKNLKRFFQAVATGDADMPVTVAINREFITVADSEKHEIILRVRIRDCSWRKIECSSSSEEEAEMPMMLLHFPEVDGNVVSESSRKTNLLQIFGYQAVLVDSMLKTMVNLMKSSEQLSDSAPSSSSSSEDGSRFVNRTPSLTKCDRMCLATFVNGQCVKASGSLKKLKETEWRKMQVV